MHIVSCCEVSKNFHILDEGKENVIIEFLLTCPGVLLTWPAAIVLGARARAGHLEQWVGELCVPLWRRQKWVPLFACSLGPLEADLVLRERSRAFIWLLAQALYCVAVHHLPMFSFLLS